MSLALLIKVFYVCVFFVCFLLSVYKYINKNLEIKKKVLLIKKPVLHILQKFGEWYIINSKGKVEINDEQSVKVYGY